MQMPNNVAGRRPARGRQRSTLAGSCSSGPSTSLSAPKSEGSGRRESTTPLPDQSPAIARIATVRFAHHYAVVASTPRRTRQSVARRTGVRGLGYAAGRRRPRPLTALACDAFGTFRIRPSTVRFGALDPLSQVLRPVSSMSTTAACRAVVDTLSEAVSTT